MTFVQELVVLHATLSMLLEFLIWSTFGVSVEISTNNIVCMYVGSLRAKLILVLSLVLDEPKFRNCPSIKFRNCLRAYYITSVKLLIFHSKQEMENHRGSTPDRRNTLLNWRRTLWRCQAGTLQILCYTYIVLSAVHPRISHLMNINPYIARMCVIRSCWIIEHFGGCTRLEILGALF